MANGLGGKVLPQLQRIFGGETLAARTDGQLLERFVTRNDAASFEALMARYGPLVLTVCRNLLQDRDDIDDAFQATFLVLVRKAGSIRLDDSLGPWLYAVAYRVASRARANRTLRIRRESPIAGLDPHAKLEDLDAYDASPLLNEELARLPERLRSPVILCYFQGLTHEMAAQELRWPVGTVRSRMARARALLRERLTRRGLILSAGFLTASARQTVAATIPPRLWGETIQAATRVAAGRAVRAGMLSAQVVALMEGVLSTMWLTRMKTSVAVAIVGGLIATGVAARAVQTPDGDGAKPAESPPAPVERPKADSERLTEAVETRRLSPSYAKAYYVGDLISLSLPGPIDKSDAKRPSPGNEPPRVDFGPLIELLTSSVAPGAWSVYNPDGSKASDRFTTVISTGATEIKVAENANGEMESKVEGANPIGSITPFLPSGSLIVRHTAEVHDEFANRLLQLRRITNPLITDPRGAAAVLIDGATEDAGKEAKPRWKVQTGSEGEAWATKRLHELEREMEQLVAERDRLTRKVDPPDVSPDRARSEIRR